MYYPSSAALAKVYTIYLKLSRSSIGILHFLRSESMLADEIYEVP